MAGRFAVPHHAARLPIHPCSRRYSYMIANARKSTPCQSWRTWFIVPLLLALLCVSPLLGLRAPVASTHGGAVAMKCVCG